MFRRGRLSCATGIVFFALLATGIAPRAGAAERSVESASADTLYTLAQVTATRDHLERPFAIVDKREARLHVFDATGLHLGSSPVLVGLTPGDTGLTHMGGRQPASLAPHERSTPSGRFETQPGYNDRGEAIVWFDYGAALAIHRLRPGPSHERRAERLASTTPDDNRASLGCIVVPVAFYETVIEPVLGRQRGVVYVLPETRPVQALFPAAPLDLGLAMH